MKIHSVTYLRRFFSLLSIVFLSTAILVAQSPKLVVKGTVKDANNEPLIGVTVLVKEKNIGTITDVDGSFELRVDKDDVVEVSSVGMIKKTYKISQSQTLNIVMEEDANILGEFVLWGYGTVQKKDLTGSIQSVKGDDLVKSLNTNITESLNGKVGGVVVSKSSNRPGDDMQIQIRGKNSFNFSNEPLFVIDGVPSATGIRHLNSSDIESIDVLKDASSAAIYGARGANGVVIVTTKGANKREGFSVDYNGYFGVKTATRIPDMIGNKGNGLEYVDYRTQLWKTKYGAASLGREDFLTKDEKSRIKDGEYYDWLREISKTAMVTNHSVNASGGSKNTSYTLGLGYTKDEGLVGKESFDRITVNVGLEQRFEDKFKIGVNTYLSFNKRNHGADEALLNAYFLPPTVSPYDWDGSYLFNCQPTSSKINPFVQIENNIVESETNYSNFSGFAELTPIKGLSLKSQIAMQTDNYLFGEWVGTLTQQKSGVNSPEAYRSESRNVNWVWDNIVNYKKDLNQNHRIDFTGLFSMQKETNKNSEMRGDGLPYESLWHAIQTADEIRDVKSGYGESSLMSLMGRVNYSLMNKYLLTLTARYDGTSKLAKENRWGVLPSVAFGWHVNEESFMKDIKAIDKLKLRIGYGKSGNLNLNRYSTRSNLDLARYTFGDKGVNGFGLSNLRGNPNLKWEMTKEWNFGLDFSFLKNRISGTVDVYDRVNDGLIMERSVGRINGYTKTNENIATTGNKGIEVTLNTVNVASKDFSWNTNIVFSLNKNRIIDLYGDKKDDLANRWFIGQPISVIYDFEKLGIWQEEEKAIAEKYGQIPGHIKVNDIYRENEDDYSLDERDFKILGSPMPDWTAGMTNTFKYRNFDLSVYAYMRKGGLYNDEFTYIFTAWDNEHWNKLDVKYWTPENRSNEYQSVGAQSYYTQVLGKVSGTFLKIQNITLGYSIPSKIMGASKIKSARVYGSVLNPFTFSGYKGADPEIIGERISKQLSLYPMTFLVGLNFNF